MLASGFVNSKSPAKIVKKIQLLFTTNSLKAILKWCDTVWFQVSKRGLTNCIVKHIDAGSSCQSFPYKICMRLARISKNIEEKKAFHFFQQAETNKYAIM